MLAAPSVREHSGGGDSPSGDASHDASSKPLPEEPPSAAVTPEPAIPRPSTVESLPLADEPSASAVPQRRAPILATGPWTKKEIAALRLACKANPAFAFADKTARFEAIAAAVGNRSAKACRTKFMELKRAQREAKQRHQSAAAGGTNSRSLSADASHSDDDDDDEEARSDNGARISATSDRKTPTMGVAVVAAEQEAEPHGPTKAIGSQGQAEGHTQALAAGKMTVRETPVSPDDRLRSYEDDSFDADDDNEGRPMPSARTAPAAGWAAGSDSKTSDPFAAARGNDRSTASYVTPAPELLARVGAAGGSWASSQPTRAVQASGAAGDLAATAAGPSSHKPATGALRMTGAAEIVLDDASDEDGLPGAKPNRHVVDNAHVTAAATSNHGIRAGEAVSVASSIVDSNSSGMNAAVTPQPPANVVAAARAPPPASDLDEIWEDIDDFEVDDDTSSRPVPAAGLSTARVTDASAVSAVATTVASPATSLQSDFDVDAEAVAAATAAVARFGVKSRPVTLETAARLRLLLYGQSRRGAAAAGGGPSERVVVRAFNQEWMRQGWYFSTLAGLRYGLIQAKGGPCGAIAAVQAETLRHLYYSDETLFEHACAADAIAATGDDCASWAPTEFPETLLDPPSLTQARRALILGISDLVWRARPADGSHATVAVAPGGAPSGPPSTLRVSDASVVYQPDGLTERLVLYECASRAAVAAVVEANLAVVRDVVASSGGVPH